MLDVMFMIAVVGLICAYWVVGYMDFTRGGAFCSACWLWVVLMRCVWVAGCWLFGCMGVVSCWCYAVACGLLL